MFTAPQKVTVNTKSTLAISKTAIFKNVYSVTVLQHFSKLLKTCFFNVQKNIKLVEL